MQVGHSPHAADGFGGCALETRPLAQRSSAEVDRISRAPNPVLGGVALGARTYAPSSAPGSCRGREGSSHGVSAQAPQRKDGPTHSAPRNACGPPRASADRGWRANSPRCAGPSHIVSSLPPHRSDRHRLCPLIGIRWPRAAPTFTFNQALRLHAQECRLKKCGARTVLAWVNSPHRVGRRCVHGAARCPMVVAREIMRHAAHWAMRRAGQTSARLAPCAVFSIHGRGAAMRHVRRGARGAYSRNTSGCRHCQTLAFSRAQI